MRRLWIVLCALACVAFSRPAAADLKIVTTTGDLAALAKGVGGKHATVTALALPTQDPHWVDARPHLALEIAKADMVVAVGMELEVSWLPTLLSGARNGAVVPGGPGYVDASQFISALEVPAGKVDRSMGDIHSQGNPHYLRDPRRAAKVALGLAERMSKLDSANAEEYAKNAKALVDQLAKWQKHWENQLAQLRGKKVITYHKSFVYLADWLGFTVPIMIEPRPGIPPNPRHVAEVIDTAKREEVRVILQEVWYPENTSKLIADKTGARVVSLAGAPNAKQNESYIGFMNAAVKRLQAAIKAK